MSPSERPAMGPSCMDAPHCPDDDRNIHDSDESSSEGQKSSEEIETLDRIEGVPWAMVQRKRVCSLDSFENKRRQLTKEQTKAIKNAMENMTAGQKQQIQRRQEKVHPRREFRIVLR